MPTLQPNQFPRNVYQHQRQAQPIFDKPGDIQPVRFAHTEDLGTHVVHQGTMEHPQGRIEEHRLFNLHDIPRAEAHQQTQHEFTHDPRTVFHARYTDPDETQLSGALRWQHSPQLHAGTIAAARDRLNFAGPAKGNVGAATERVFPLRLTEETKPKIAKDQGTLWGGTIRPGSKPTQYRNEAEDPGSISVGVHLGNSRMSPTMAGSQLRTHTQLVREAIDQGKHVRPRAQWDVEHGQPDYDPELQHNWAESISKAEGPFKNTTIRHAALETHRQGGKRRSAALKRYRKAQSIRPATSPKLKYKGRGLEIDDPDHDRTVTL